MCQVTNTPDGHFIVDRHPELDNVYIVGGGSGHGFKHGPRVGQFAAGLTLGEEVDEEYRRTFSLKREPA